jgi:hypothetical protein
MKSSTGSSGYLASRVSSDARIVHDDTRPGSSSDRPHLPISGPLHDQDVVALRGASEPGRHRRSRHSRLPLHSGQLV